MSTIPGLGPLIISRRSGSEPLRARSETVGRLGHSWSWACSDLANNTMRGVLAEYVVATAWVPPPAPAPNGTPSTSVCPRGGASR